MRTSQAPHTLIATTLFDFRGSTFSAALDGPRLQKQLHAVAECMADGEWRTLAEIAAATGAPEASVSARLRDLRRRGFAVDRRRRSKGQHEYRVRSAP